MRTIILSVKPEFAKKILNKDKTIELRKLIGKFFMPGNTIFIYESSPSKKMVASCIIEKIETIGVGSISNEQLKKASVERIFYDTYFAKKNVAHLIHLSKVKPMKNPLSLEFMRQYEFTPPQSFCYASNEFLKLLEGEK